jgi:hypothetical protein
LIGAVGPFRFGILALDTYIQPMPKKPLDLPMKVAKAFVKDMKLYFAEPNAIKRDEIAGRQMHELRKYQGPRERPIRIPDIKEMFEEMRDHP